LQRQNKTTFIIRNDFAFHIHNLAFIKKHRHPFLSDGAVFTFWI